MQDTRDAVLIPGLGRSPRAGNGKPLQYSCLEKSMDRGAWWATVRGVAKSWIWLNNRHTLRGGVCSHQDRHLSDIGLPLLSRTSARTPILGLIGSLIHSHGISLDITNNQIREATHNNQHPPCHPEAGGLIEHQNNLKMNLQLWEITLNNGLHPLGQSLSIISMPPGKISIHSENKQLSEHIHSSHNSYSFLIATTFPKLWCC